MFSVENAAITMSVDFLMDCLEDSYDTIEDGGIAEKGITLGEEEYFVLGDNRNNSEDSRSANVGAVKAETIAGKAWFKLGNSIDRIGFIE